MLSSFTRVLGEYVGLGCAYPFQGCFGGGPGGAAYDDEDSWLGGGLDGAEYSDFDDDEIWFGGGPGGA